MPRVVVVGAGAAGTMAAIFAATHGADTRLLERTKDGGRKILISGGGRCNILPAQLDESRFVTESSMHTLRKIVRAWPLQAQIAFFERELHLPLVEETETGKLFPRSQSARDVRDKLLALARRVGVHVVTGRAVTGIEQTASGWIIARAEAEPLDADAIILATGGLSVPNTGSDGFGLQIAAELGHIINPTYAALTPLVSKWLRDPFSIDAPEKGSRSHFGQLSGVSLPVTITARSDKRSAEAHGGFLFTHRGYSGPAVLDVSHVAVRSLAEAAEPAAISVRWSRLGDRDWENALQPKGSRTVLAAVGAELPHRLAVALLTAADVEPARTLSHLTRAERQRLIDTLVRGRLPWSGDEGYTKAEVTGGGVGLAEIDPMTMESRRHRRLFLCGEMLDAFGPIGGYNFLWAWVTGRSAGIGAAGCYA